MFPFVLIFTAVCIFSYFSGKIIGQSYFKQLAAGIVGGSVTMVVIALVYARIYEYPFFFFN
jgi:hypothetical protein